MSEIELSYETQILVASDRDGLRRQLREILAKSEEEPGDNMRGFLDGSTDAIPTYVTDTFLVGTPEEVEAQIESYRNMGFSHFLLWFMDAPRPEGMEVFAREVMPRFR